MSVLTEEQSADLIAKAGTYDYIRFSWTDLNGIPRGKTIPGRFATDAVKNGVGTYTGTLTFGPRTEIPFIQRIHDTGYGNSNFVPASKLYELPWAGEGKYKVGQVICETFWQDGTLVDPNPRTVARKQLEKLEAMGYKFLSGFEAEFIVVNPDTMEPVTDGVDFCSDLIFSKNASWIYDLEQNLRKCDIHLGAMHNEYSPGQFEMAINPKYGMETFDDMLIFKQAAKEILSKHGVKPTFMTRPFGNFGGSSGQHLSHSLWDAQGKCVFYDASKPDKMSDTMRYWVGGIMKHIKALLVLCSSTPNCFRRLHRPWAPDKEDWDIDNRFTSIRAKTVNERCCLVENRLPGSACNAYIVAAATIAAGIDGIEKKIEPPPKGIRDANPALPSMKDAIAALEADTDLVNSLGTEFVEWWVKAKRNNEMTKFANQTFGDNIPEEEIAKERKEYFDFI